MRSKIILNSIILFIITIILLLTSCSSKPTEIKVTTLCSGCQIISPLINFCTNGDIIPIKDSCNCTVDFECKIKECDCEDLSEPSNSKCLGELVPIYNDCMCVVGYKCEKLEEYTPAENTLTPTDINSEWSDGTCNTNSDCIVKEFGCGGGHIMCTSNPSKYDTLVSTCEIVENHPSTNGYSCGCINNKCVWNK